MVCAVRAPRDKCVIENGEENCFKEIEVCSYVAFAVTVMSIIRASNFRHYVSLSCGLRTTKSVYDLWVSTSSNEAMYVCVLYSSLCGNAALSWVSISYARRAGGRPSIHVLGF